MNDAEFAAKAAKIDQSASRLADTLAPIMRAYYRKLTEGPEGMPAENAIMLVASLQDYFMRILGGNVQNLDPNR